MSEDINVGAISEALNNKLDLDGNNKVTPNGLTSIGFPSSRYIGLTLGASGTIYTAPANGYVYIAGNANSNSVHLTRLDGLGICCGLRNDNYINLYLPVLAGMTYTISHSGFSANQLFRFYYAEGSN